MGIVVSVVGGSVGVIANGPNHPCSTCRRINPLIRWACGAVYTRDILVVHLLATALFSAPGRWLFL
jgi:hypothetical protein